FEGEGGVAVPTMEARITWCPARLDPAEEGGKRAVQAREHVLQHLGVDIPILRAHILDGRQLGALAGCSEADAALLPGVPALLHPSFVDSPAPPQDKLHRPFLLGSGLELVFEGLAYGERFHNTLFCLPGTNLARPEGQSSPGYSRGAFWPISVR